MCRETYALAVHCRCVPVNFDVGRPLSWIIDARFGHRVRLCSDPDRPFKAGSHLAK